METFGDVLRRLRKNKRLSQDAFAAAADLNGQTISNIETGKTSMPRGDTYRAIAKALEMTVEELDAVVGITMYPIPIGVLDGLRARATLEKSTLDEWLQRQASLTVIVHDDGPVPSPPELRGRGGSKPKKGNGQGRDPALPVFPKK